MTTNRPTASFRITLPASVRLSALLFGVVAVAAAMLPLFQAAATIA